MSEEIKNTEVPETPAEETAAPAAPAEEKAPEAAPAESAAPAPAAAPSGSSEGAPASRPAQSGRPGGDRPRNDDRRPRQGGPRDGQRSPRFRRKVCRFCYDKSLVIDYKQANVLEGFITDRGKILPRRVTGTCSKHQRIVAREIKRARIIALLPFVEQ